MFVYIHIYIYIHTHVTQAARSWSPGGFRLLHGDVLRSGHVPDPQRGHYYYYYYYDYFCLHTDM